jgi:hypothetical protein
MIKRENEAKRWYIPRQSEFDHGKTRIAEHRHEDEIARPVPERLVRDRDIPASRVLDFWHFHAESVPPD